MSERRFFLADLTHVHDLLGIPLAYVNTIGVGIVLIIATFVYVYMDRHNALRRVDRLILRSDEAFSKTLQRALLNMKTKKGSSESEISRIKLFLGQITPEIIAGYTAQTRLLAAKWILNNQTMGNSMMIDQGQILSEYEIWELNLAWILMNFKDAKVDRQAELVRIDLALRHQQRKLLKDHYIALRYGYKDLNESEILHLFTVAPILGQWDDTRIFGKKINNKENNKENTNALELFHDLAIQRPTLIDYYVLYQLSEKGLFENEDIKKQQKTKPWGITMNMTSLRTYLKDIECMNVPIRTNLMRNLAPNGNIKWNSPHVHVQKRICVTTGSVAQLSSLSFENFPLVGRYNDTEMTLEGYCDYIDENNMMLRKSETLSISKYTNEREAMIGLGLVSDHLPNSLYGGGEEIVWAGSYVLKQEVLDDDDDDIRRQNNTKIEYYVIVGFTK